MTIMNIRIDYRYAHFNFEYTWLRDKQIIHKGNQFEGMLIILDEDGKTVGWYAYELISDYE